ncbi:hypothetical protein USDA257_c08270 [Sinorhizobium fredii USDA 257]|uniref:Uncharacterized protein n=1 Tax=Sinorhizobium fredii (strain USDA 257) TaxID=1185652 RepID=I3X0L3_SINF2|nr:hypothetical protein USDA257_c08270 [Sinorhizobium fredii USDA 257]
MTGTLALHRRKSYLFDYSAVRLFRRTKAAVASLNYCIFFLKSNTI